VKARGQKSGRRPKRGGIVGRSSEKEPETIKTSKGSLQGRKVETSIEGSAEVQPKHIIPNLYDVLRLPTD